MVVHLTEKRGPVGSAYAGPIEHVTMAFDVSSFRLGRTAPWPVSPKAVTIKTPCEGLGSGGKRTDRVSAPLQARSPIPVRVRAPWAGV